MVKDKKEMKTVKVLVHAALLLIALFVIAFVSRIFTGYFDHVAVVHAILVAPFNAFVGAFYLRYFRMMTPLAIALLALSLVLGMMSWQMAIGFFVPMVVMVLVWQALNSKRQVGPFVAGFVLGSFPYLTLIIIAMATGGLTFFSGDITQILYLLIALGLAFVGALAGGMVAHRIQARRKEAVEVAD